MTKDLSGDRYIEYGWLARQLPVTAGEHAHVFDLGPSEDMTTTKFALSRGYSVTAIGLMPTKFEHPGLEFVQADFLQYNTGHVFDWIINISTIEHFGIAGRYGVMKDQPDADLEGMARLRTLMEYRSYMVLTIPIGRDNIVRPYHRVYGRERLPLLLDGYRVLKAEYWGKRDTQFWDKIDSEEALNTVASMQIPTYYALGLFLCNLK